MCFAVNFAKFLRTPFLQTTTGPLLLINLYFGVFLGGKGLTKRSNFEIKKNAEEID